jgi:hypothetical protein
MAPKEPPPGVLWAQRSSDTEAEKNFIYLTIDAPDVNQETMKLDLKPTTLSFTGHSKSRNVTYHVELEFFAEIDVDNSKTNASPRDISLKLQKKELRKDYWPRLLKSSEKQHFLKTDFDKWVDEDEQDAAADDLGGGDLGGGDLGGLDFSKLGGMGGMGGLGGMGGMGGGLDDDDMDLGADKDNDDDMPDLEGEADEQEDAGVEDAGDEAAVGTKETGAAADDAASDAPGTTAAAAASEESDTAASQPTSKIQELS